MLWLTTVTNLKRRIPRFAVAYHSNLDKEEVRQKEAQFTVNQKVVYNDCCGLPQCQTSKKGAQQVACRAAAAPTISC